jgi:hypothetical protein
MDTRSYFFFWKATFSDANFFSLILHTVIITLLDILKNLFCIRFIKHELMYAVFPLVCFQLPSDYHFISPRNWPTTRAQSYGPPRSPHFTPLNFSLRGLQNDVFCVPMSNKVLHLNLWIARSCGSRVSLVRSRHSPRSPLGHCRVTKDAHITHSQNILAILVCHLYVLHTTAFNICVIQQCFSTFMRPRPSKFFFL